MALSEKSEISHFALVYYDEGIFQDEKKDSNKSLKLKFHRLLKCSRIFASLFPLKSPFSLSVIPIFDSFTDNYFCSIISFMVSSGVINGSFGSRGARLPLQPSPRRDTTNNNKIYSR